MKRAYLSILFGCFCAIGATAQTTTPPPPATTAGAVVRISFIDIKTGKGTDYMNFLRTHTKPILDEQKKQGLILDYKFFSQPSFEGTNDWDIAQVIVYKNYADAVDFNAERGAKFNAISIGHYGSVEARTKAGDLQNELRTVLSSKLMREQILNPMPK
jgi:hypothetical protein